MMEHGLTHIDLKQIRYAMRGKADDSAPNLKVEETVSGEEREDRALQYLREILRCFLGLSKNIRLYPVKSDVIGRILRKLIKYLRHFIRLEGILTFSRAEDALLVNGKKVFASEPR